MRRRERQVSAVPGAVVQRASDGFECGDVRGAVAHWHLALSHLSLPSLGLNKYVKLAVNTHVCQICATVAFAETGIQRVTLSLRMRQASQVVVLFEMSIWLVRLRTRWSEG
jgi:hypothetical protein